MKLAFSRLSRFEDAYEFTGSACRAPWTAMPLTRRSEWAKDWRVPAYTRFAPLLKASSNQCPSDTLIGPGHQNCFVFDGGHISYISETCVIARSISHDSRRVQNSSVYFSGARYNCYCSVRAEPPDLGNISGNPKRGNREASIKPSIRAMAWS
jgi:hypothetical protein